MRATIYQLELDEHHVFDREICHARDRGGMMYLGKAADWTQFVPVMVFESEGTIEDDPEHEAVGLYENFLMLDVKRYTAQQVFAGGAPVQVLWQDRKQPPNLV